MTHRTSSSETRYAKPAAVIGVAFVLLLTATPAFADLTAFIGSGLTPVSRPAKGVSIGTGLIIVGFEFEYAAVDESSTTSSSGQIAPAFQTYMFNGLLQTPIEIARTQFYGTAGGGIYHETFSFDPTGNVTNFGTNVGGGAKIRIIGPLRLRLDYRVFTLHNVQSANASIYRGNPRSPTLQRFYAGINLKF